MERVKRIDGHLVGRERQEVNLLEYHRLLRADGSNRLLTSAKSEEID